MNFLLFWLSFVLLVAPATAEKAPRYQAVLSPRYTGAHMEAFTGQHDQVRLWVRQAQLEVSSQLGLLQYQEGFRYPISIEFADGAPPGVENALAFVQMGENQEGFIQRLVINLAAPQEGSFELQTVFFHEMTHAVMNDAVGGQATMKLPRWLHEGLAQYIGGDGEKRLTQLCSQYRKNFFTQFRYDLDAPDGSLAYAQFYLGVKYILQRKGINSLQALVRNLIAGMPYDQAIEDSCAQKLPAFKASVRDYSLDYFKDKALSDY